MEFPPSFNTFTIPNGAGPTDSRIVLYENGELVSYDLDDTPPRFVALFHGQVLVGPLNPDGTADGPDAGGFLWTMNGGIPALLIVSPMSQLRPTQSEIFLSPAALGGRPTVSVQGESNSQADLFVAGDVHSQNLAAGIASITTVANQWVYTNVTFTAGETDFTTPPAVVITGNNAGPAAGGTTTLEYAVTAVTTTGFSLGVMRGTATTMNVAWLAVAPT